MIFLDNDTDIELGFDYKEIAEKVIELALKTENCPFETEVNILLTQDDEIHEINLSERGIDSPTDVLSFPGIFFDKAGDFKIKEEEMADYIDPETGLVVLGDIVVNLDRVIKQAEEYGHSELREYAFLIAHSILHLCGYDHMEDDEAKIMEEKQENILKALNITRD